MINVEVSVDCIINFIREVSTKITYGKCDELLFFISSKGQGDIISTSLKVIGRIFEEIDQINDLLK